MRSAFFSGLGAVFALVFNAVAQTTQYCPSSDSTVCYTFNVPQTASSGSGDIYFQIKGPTSKSWIGLGQSPQGGMSNANIFIIYANAAGNNVTLSPRLGKGNVQPQYDSSAQVFLLDGTGIENGVMTANIRCSNCASWSGGTMDLKSSSSGWIWASKEGSSIGSDSQTADLRQHNKKDSFTLDLTKAQGGNSVNPFTAAAASTGSSSTSSQSSSSQSGQSGEMSMSGEKQRMKRILITHGVLMCLAFVIFYPLGAIIIRVLSFSGLVWVHAAVQWFAFAMALAGMGLGAYIGTREEYQLDQYHPVIGLLVLGLLLLQPPTGIIHHKIFKRDGKASPIWSRVHTINGRLAITLGIINGGLGLRFSGNTKNGEIAYGVVAGVVWVVWMAAAVWGVRSKKAKNAAPAVAKTEREGSN